MLRRAFAVCAVLGLISTAQAGVIVTLVPLNAGPYDINNPGSLTTQVQVLARLETAVPAPAPGNPGARLRLAQFDVGASDAAIGITPVTTHSGLDILDGDIAFWDFSSTSNCTNNPTECGDQHFVDDSIAADDILNITFTGQQSSSTRQITLTTTDKVVGLLEIQLPSAPGTYTLDVLNRSATGDAGAEFRHGFGTATDPSVTYSADATGQILGGTRAFTVIPEPATLALLGLGGLAAAFRRRSA